MNKLRKQFWIYLRLAVVFAALAGFFAYSFGETMRMSMEGPLSDRWNQLSWYHPAVFWFGGFSDRLVSVFRFVDPAIVANSIMRTITMGLAFTFLVTEALVVLAGREFALVRTDMNATVAPLQKKQSPPWNRILYGAFLGGAMILAVALVPLFSFMFFRRAQWDIVVSLNLILFGFSGFLFLCLYGLWQMEQWGFWGLVIGFLLTMFLALIAGAPVVTDIGWSLFWIIFLLIVVFAGGENRVWDKMR